MARRRSGESPPWAWRLLNGAVLWLLRTVFGWRVRISIQDEVPPADRPLLLAFNHTSQIDGFVVAHTVWRATGHWGQPLVKEEVFDVPVVGWLGRGAGAVPVGRSSDSDRAAAFDAAIARLRDGGCVMIAPEATITHDGHLLPMRHGAARMALEAGCDVLVVTHFGAQRAWSPVAGLPQRGAVVDLAVDVVRPRPDDDPASLTGRIGATMLDRMSQLADQHPVGGPHEPWWPPYSQPAEPSRVGRQNLEQFRETMAASVAEARARAERLREEARERVHEVVETAEHRAHELSERAHELSERAHEVTDSVRERVHHVVEAAEERAHHLSDTVRERVQHDDATDDSIDDPTDAATDDDRAVS